VLELAFATYRNLPELSEDDRLVVAALCREGIAVTPAVWNASEVDWSQFAGVVIRSTWDYHLNADKYAQWISKFRQTGTRLWNPPEVVLQNMNKGYLLALAAKGVEVVPTTYLTAPEERELRKILMDCNLKDAVVKPAVSAWGSDAWRTSQATADVDQKRFAEQIRSRDLLIQPYLPEIAAHGEWSFVFLDGRYSHAAIKRPAESDFRVQREFGGTSAPAKPPATLIEQAEAILSTVEHELLYARVDAIERSGRLILMELELIEPFLFIGFSDGAAQRFAQAIVRAVERKGDRSA
jgi:glutathione synthase/RimK-type ligase-like ATP-grasp enzyme